jgi:hypothetical protein
MPKLDPEMEPIDIDKLENVQNRLAAALLKVAKINIAAKDWVQGGWSRSGKVAMDKLDFGMTKAGKIVEKPIN